jgi:hypothetical protein
VVKICQDYTNSQGKTYKGCGQPLKWVNATPLTQVGEWPGGRPKYAGGYEHYDGSPSRHDDENPPSQKAYQQTYAPQIEQHDKEQAQLAAQGFKEATSNAFAEKFINTTVERITAALKAADNAETKAHANNLSLGTLGKNIDDIRLSQIEMRDEFRLLHEKVDATLSSVSFQGADKMYKKEQNPAHGKVILAEAEETVGDDDETVEVDETVAV